MTKKTYNSICCYNFKANSQTLNVYAICKLYAMKLDISSNDSSKTEKKVVQTEHSPVKGN